MVISLDLQTGGPGFNPGSALHAQGSPNLLYFRGQQIGTIDWG